jgi:hypothetical protein
LHPNGMLHALTPGVKYLMQGLARSDR